MISVLTVIIFPIRPAGNCVDQCEYKKCPGNDECLPKKEVSKETKKPVVSKPGGGANGDPHFVTWSHEIYDFHGRLPNEHILQR